MLTERNCPQCGGTFQPQRERAKFCSRRCQKLNGKQRARKRKDSGYSPMVRRSSGAHLTAKGIEWIRAAFTKRRSTADVATELNVSRWTVARYYRQFRAESQSR